MFGNENKEIFKTNTTYSFINFGNQNEHLEIDN
jgi:hypothetical protein